MSNWTTAQANAALKRAGVKDHLQQACGAPKPAKYRNVRVWVDGNRFDSRAEARAYVTLRTLAGIGEITNLQLQPRYELQAKFTDGHGVKHRSISYIGDFEFLRDGKRVCVDVKGVEAAGFRTKFKLAINLYPEILFEVWR